MEEAMRLSREEAHRRAQIRDPTEEALFDDGYEQYVPFDADAPNPTDPLFRTDTTTISLT